MLLRFIVLVSSTRDLIIIMPYTSFYDGSYVPDACPCLGVRPNIIPAMGD